MYLSHKNNESYKGGMYLRLSKEDEAVGKSESIENQQKIIEKFALENNFKICKAYTDDGFSGLNFKRPAFTQLIKDIEKDKIDLVITKDLSRLGRDYIDTGYYIERYFPQKNVRYIAISDNIDTYTSNSGNDISPFKSIINDMYARDISKKIRAVMDTKRQNGEFIGAFAPYGYLKNPCNKNGLIIDKSVYKTIERIYNMYISCGNMGYIADVLNRESVPCPSKYKQIATNYKNPMQKHYKWCRETIKRILTNPVYMGCMTQHRQEKISYKIDKLRKVPKEDWIVVPNTHTPIVEEETFYLVQEIFQRKTSKYNSVTKTSHLLSGLVFCKECGGKMSYRRSSSGKMMMNCMNYLRFGPNRCSSHNISEKVALEAVLNDLKLISKKLLKEDFFTSLREVRFKSKEDYFISSEKNINKRINQIRYIIKSLYEDKAKN